MSSLFLSLAAAAALRVCADPANLPFSDAQGRGFENRIAELIARESHARVEYTWFAQRRTFLRNTLNAGRCDVVIGYTQATERALTTRPYYTSTYVLVSAPHVRPPVKSLDDPRLAKLRIGAHMASEDFIPPVHALARRGIRDVRAYSLYEPGAMFDSLRNNTLDVAISWGPFAGYYAPKSAAVAEIVPKADGPIPFTFPISVAVRKGDTELRDRIQSILDRKRGEVDAILRSYRVPRVQP
jgi:mxaJ protein